MSIRLIVCIDVDVKTLREAYDHTSKALDQLYMPVSFAWETSDEWYDENGEQGDVEALNSVATEVIMKRERDKLR
jgi:hypothetical protein